MMNEQDEKFFEKDQEVLRLRRSKRSEKLFEQAANKEFPNEVISIHPDELRKFAELIVRECAEVPTMIYGINWEQAVKTSDTIKKHFGVNDD